MLRTAGTSKVAFKKVTHVIFDLDGLLLDTEKLYTEAVQTVLGKFGKEYTYEVKVQMMGLTGVEMAKAMVEAYKLPLSWEDYYKLAKEQYALIMPNAALMPDTETVYERVISGIAKAHGKKYTAEVRMKLLGRVEQETSQLAVSEMSLPISPADFLKQFKTQSMKLLRDVALMPGAERFIKHLHGHRIPIAVATSSNQESYNFKVTNHKELFSLFNHVVAGGTDPEVKKGKPSPDVFQVCCARFKDKPKPGDCLVFEDAPNGVTAAIAAGMQCVVIPDPQTPKETYQHATLHLNSMADVQPELFGLPPFK